MMYLGALSIFALVYVSHKAPDWFEALGRLLDNGIPDDDQED